MGWAGGKKLPKSQHLECREVREVRPPVSEYLTATSTSICIIPVYTMHGPGTRPFVARKVPVHITGYFISASGGIFWIRMYIDPSEALRTVDSNEPWFNTQINGYLY